MFSAHGVTVVTDPLETEVVTTWRKPGHGIVLKKVDITSEMALAHDRAVRRARDMSTWTSQTVAVVDQSGSMREIDMDMLIMRSDLIWLNLAMEVVAKGLKSGERKDTDVLSVVSMRTTSEVVIRNQPFDWILYNTLVDLLYDSAPSEGGCYIPALDTASALLNACRNSHCVKSLVFLSDGRPSDPLKKGVYKGMKGSSNEHERVMGEYVTEKIAELASSSGKRLSICGVGIGKSCEHEFGVIKAMLDEAKEYECHVIFEYSCVSSRQLSTALSATTQASTTSMTHIAEIDRNEVLREFIKQPLREVGRAVSLTDTWTSLMMSRTLDPHSRRNQRSIVRTRWVQDEGWVSYATHNTFHHPEATGVAFEKRWFGEGKERLVKEFREIDRNYRFVGSHYVAKDSITIRRNGTKQDFKQFQKKFVLTHLFSQQVADTFNRLARLTSLDQLVPRIEFLQCWVFMLNLEDGDRQAFLVEPMLNVRQFPYQKFNDNQGWQRETGCLAQRSLVLRPNPLRGASTSGLPVYIEEEDEGEEETSGEADSQEVAFRMEDVPQAFSCFSRHYFRGQKLVCDLQGIHDTSQGVFRLTDPVIHSVRSRFSRNKEERYGRTDRGREGISDFLRTHRCSPLCCELKEQLRAQRKQRRRKDIQSTVPNAD